MPSVARRPRHNRNANGSKSAGSARPSCSPSASAKPIAYQLGVSRQAVSLWSARWQAGGTDALCSRGPTGPWLNIELADLPAAVEHAVDLSALPTPWPNLTLMRSARRSRRP